MLKMLYFTLKDVYSWVGEIPISFIGPGRSSWGTEDSWLKSMFLLFYITKDTAYHIESNQLILVNLLGERSRRSLHDAVGALGLTSYTIEVCGMFVVPGCGGWWKLHVTTKRHFPILNQKRK